MDYFLELIASQLNNRKPISPKSEVDWQEVYRLAKIHSLVAVVFSAINKLEEELRPEAELYSKIKKDFLLYIHQNTSIVAYADNLIKALEREKLEHILIKGYVLKDYYPCTEFRSMSDVDILIKKEDRERAHELMTSMGYKNTIRDKGVWNYKKKSSLIELHTSLVEEEIKEGVDFSSYFSKACSHLEPYRGSYSKTLDKSYHFIYLLVHMAKHFHSCGCGVRMVMDIAVFMDKFRDELDMKFIEAELKELELELFAQNILVLCNRWFGTDIGFSYELEEKFYEDISRTILLGGTFGFENSNFRIAKIRNESRATTYEASLGKTIRSMAFPSYEELVKYEKYAFVKDRKYLIPLAWIYRIYNQLRTRGLNSFTYVGDILSSKNRAEEEGQTIKKLGL